jgi:hypothetical protein
MIQTNELRIGNYIHRLDLKGGVGYIDCEKRMIGIKNAPLISVKVAGVVSGKVIFGDGVQEAECLSPIPLTEEILLKCGFEDMGYGLYSLVNLFLNSNNDGFGIEISSNEDSFFKGVRITSLHQLQNLYFALTGEELEIQL